MDSALHMQPSFIQEAKWFGVRAIGPLQKKSAHTQQAYNNNGIKIVE